MGRHAGPDGLPAQGDQAVLQPAREQGISAGRGSGSARAAPHDTAYGRPRFLHRSGPRPRARGPRRAGSRSTEGGWATERIHDSDTFCRFVIRSDTGEVATENGSPTSSVSEKLVDRYCFRILFLNCDVSSAGVHGRLSWSAAIVTHLVTQDFLLLVQESEEIRHMRVMTASQASA